MPKRYWLLKTEPDSYSIDDLKRDGKTRWTGVRNYQARNFMRDAMKAGDEVLIYHSSAEPPGVAGLAKISGDAIADPTALDAKDDHHDPKSTKAEPIWVAVEVTFVKKFARIVSLDELKAAKELGEMLVLKRGQRLSVQPVDVKHFELVVKMGAPSRPPE